jgi:RimJ/RimL family protein N-acetyltransferase
MDAASYRWGDHLPALGTPRTRLRGLTDGDAPDLLSIFGDPEVMRYWSSAPLPDLAAALALVGDIRRHFEARTLFQWGIARREDDRVIGTCTLFRLDSAHRRGELGFALGREHWRRGLATEAVARVIRFAFELLDLHRIEADVDPRNQASLRVLEKQGFRREGHLRERYHVNGEIQDAVFLGLLRPEWTPPANEPG